MKKEYYNLTVIFVIVVGVLLVFHYEPFTWSEKKLKRVYKGEGTIKSKGGLGTGSGYTIEFDEFSLNKEFSKKYKIQKVPELGKTAFIELRVLVSVEKFKRYKAENSEILKSIIKFSVENSKGKKIFEISAPMQDFGFGEVPSDPFFPLDLYYISKNKSSVIDYWQWEEGNLTIHLHFKPGKKVFPKGTKGMLLVSCGGHK